MSVHGSGDSSGMESRRRYRVFGALAAVVTISLGGVASHAFNADSSTATAAADGAQATAVEAKLSHSSQEPPAPFFSGDEMVGQGLSPRLDAARTPVYPASGLSGWLSPVGVPSFDGKWMAYNGWTKLVQLDPQLSNSDQGISTGDALARPSIHVVDTSTGEDKTLADGAFSVAWSADGRLAYFAGVKPDYRANLPYEGGVLVQQGVDGEPMQWTSDRDQYIVAAWAGKTLIAYRQYLGEEHDLVALDGPESIRVLAPQAELIALSPDGTEALVNEDNAARVAVIDVATGKELSALDLSQVVNTSTGDALTYVGYAGDWQGDEVVAEAGRALIFLRIVDGKVALDRLLTFPRSAGIKMPLHEPRFTSPDGESVVAWMPYPDPSAESGSEAQVYSYIACDVGALTCDQGPTGAAKTYFSIENPSRPTG